MIGLRATRMEMGHSSSLGLNFSRVDGLKVLGAHGRETLCTPSVRIYIAYVEQQTVCYKTSMHVQHFNSIQLLHKDSDVEKRAVVLPLRRH
jgi:hypothetical protein